MLTKFVAWVKSKRIDEGIYGQWEYRIPSDPKELMYDFYTLEYLLSSFQPSAINAIISGWPKSNPFRPPRVNPETGQSYEEPGSPEAPMTNEMKAYHALFETATKLLPILKQHLLDGVMFSIGAELRHVDKDVLSSMTSSTESQTKVKDLINGVSAALGKEYGELFRKYVIAYGNYTGQMKPLMPREPLNRLVKDSSQGYRTSYRAMKAAGGSDEDWAKIAAYLFKNAKWRGAYGGQNWANIANGWLHLNAAKKPTDIIAYIDHVYDLQHNTGSVFTKLQKYEKNGSYEWIEKALDHKRDAVSPHEFMEHVSPSMRDLALIGIKLKTGKTWEDFQKEWPEIAKEKTAVYNRGKVIKWQKEKEKYEKDTGHAFHGSPPKPISVDQFERSHITVNNHPFNLGKLTKHHQEEEDVRFGHLLPGATQEIPELSDFKAGDEIALQWPPRHWFQVTSCGDQEYCDKVTIKYPDGTQYLSTDHGTLSREKIKGFRSKETIAKHAKEKQKPVVKPDVHYNDYYGNPIKLGDTVKKFTSSFDRIGTVVAMGESHVVRVRWNTGAEKDYFTHLLVVQKEGAKEPEKPQEVKDKDGKVIKIGDYVKSGTSDFVGKVYEIDDKNGIVSFKDESGWALYKPASELQVVEKPKPQEVKDKNGKVITVGDYVKSGMFGFTGKVFEINDKNGIVSFKGESGVTKHKPSSEVEVVGKPPEKPKEAPKFKDAGGIVVILVGDPVAYYGDESYKGTVQSIDDSGKVTVKWSSGAIATMPHNKLKVLEPLKSPSGAPIPAKQQASIKEIWDDLAGTPVNLRFARVLKGMKKLGGQNYHDLLTKISQEVGAPVNLDETMKTYWQEDANEKFYKGHGAGIYPGVISPEAASNVIAHTFSSAPYVYLPHKTIEAVEKALLAHNNDLAANIIAKATKFSSAAAKGLAIYTKLGMYAAGAFHA